MAETFRYHGQRKQCAGLMKNPQKEGAHHEREQENARCELSPVLLAAAGLVRRTVYQVISVDEKADNP